MTALERLEVTKEQMDGNLDILRELHQELKGTNLEKHCSRKIGEQLFAIALQKKRIQKEKGQEVR